MTPESWPHTLTDPRPMSSGSSAPVGCQEPWLLATGGETEAQGCRDNGGDHLWTGTQWGANLPHPHLSIFRSLPFCLSGCLSCLCVCLYVSGPPLSPGLTDGTSGKESTCQCRGCKSYRFNPWVGKTPRRRKWQRTPVFLPGESHGQRSLVGFNPWGHKESDTTE